MLAVLSSQSQITIPDPIVSRLGLKEGDQFEIFEESGMIRMIPIVVYPQKYVEQLNKEIQQLKNNIKSGKQHVFSNIDDLINELDKS